jgi:hypothetical protein
LTTGLHFLEGIRGPAYGKSVYNDHQLGRCRVLRTGALSRLLGRVQQLGR